MINVEFFFSEGTSRHWKVMSSQGVESRANERPQRKNTYPERWEWSLGEKNLKIIEIANKCISSQQAYQNGEIYPYQKNIGTVSKINDGSQLKWDQHQR